MSVTKSLNQGRKIKGDKSKPSGNFRDGLKPDNGVQERVRVRKTMGTCCLHLNFKTLSVSHGSLNAQVKATVSKLSLVLSWFVHLLNWP